MTRILVTTDVSELGHGALAHAHRVADREGAAPPPVSAHRCPRGGSVHWRVMPRVPVKPEVMSPVGGEAQLRAAVEAGADAVFFGVNPARDQAGRAGRADGPRFIATSAAGLNPRCASCGRNVGHGRPDGDR